MTLTSGVGVTIPPGGLGVIGVEVFAFAESFRGGCAFGEALVASLPHLR
jgi:hypothetical protein